MTTATLSVTFATDELARLGEALAVDGLADHELAVRRFVGAARRAGLSSAALAVLADTSVIEPVRLRAFGRAAAQYVRQGAPAPTPTPATRTRAA